MTSRPTHPIIVRDATIIGVGAEPEPLALGSRVWRGTGVVSHYRANTGEYRVRRDDGTTTAWLTAAQVKAI